jgi:hypothetical protein
MLPLQHRGTFLQHPAQTPEAPLPEWTLPSMAHTILSVPLDIHFNFLILFSVREYKEKKTVTFARIILKEQFLKR